MFRISYILVKLLALLLGFLGVMISLMALAGLLFENVLLRAGLAAALTFVAPLFVANLFIPKDQEKGLGSGVISDTYALVWLAVATLFIGAAYPLTDTLLEDEAARLDRNGHHSLAAITRFTIGSGHLPVALAATNQPGTANATSQPAGDSEMANNQPAASGTAAHGDQDKQDKADAKARADKDEPKTEKPAPPTDPGHKVMTPAEIFHVYSPSVVTVSVRTPVGMGSGTGFILDTDGTIATNHHVIDHARHVRIKLVDGTWIEQVELLTSDKKVDLALLKVPAKHALKPVLLGASNKITVGERVVSIGNPLGLDHTLTDGLISARRVWEGRKMIQMSAPVSPGNSGGPLFNMQGRVVGITTAKLGNAFNRGDALNLAVPIDVLKGMLKPEYPDRSSFGTTTW